MIKVTYRSSPSGSHNTTAYLDDDRPLSDGSLVGTNKHSDGPVHLKWDDDLLEWVHVCYRACLGFNPITELFSYAEAPMGCSCEGVGDE